MEGVVEIEAVEELEGGCLAHISLYEREYKRVTLGDEKGCFEEELTLISVGSFRWSPISNTFPPKTRNNFSSSSTVKNCTSSTPPADDCAGVLPPSLAAGVLPP